MAKRPASSQNLTRRQMSRAKREALLQRWIVIGAIVMGVAAVGAIGYGLLDENYLKPNTPVVTVGDLKITGSQFETQVRANAFFQLGGQIPLSAYGLDAQSYSKIILDNLTNDLLVEQKAKEKGIVVTDADVLREAQLSFGYDGGTPAPTATITETTVPTARFATATSTFVVTLTPSPTTTTVPGPTNTPTLTLTPTSEPTSTPTAGGPPTITPSPQPTSTPLDEAGYNTELDNFLTQAATATGLTNEQVKSAWLSRVRAGILRDRLLVALDIKPAKEKTMIHAAHLLVATEEEAKKALERIKAGEDFEKVAAEVSTDTSNAYKGGDLGWFGPDVMDKDFQAGAENATIGEVTEPVKSAFGWHLIMVYARKQIPTTGSEQQQETQDKMSEMFEQWKTDYNVVVDDTWQQFVPNIQ